MTVAVLGTGDEAPAVAYVVAAQADPTRHVTYVGSEPVSALADLAAATAWRERTFVAHEDGGAINGVLTVDVDEDLGRLWWLGPWADDAATAQALIAAATDVAGSVREREFAPDARNTVLIRLATELGYRAEEPSAVLVRNLATWSPATTRAAAAGAPSASLTVRMDNQRARALCDSLGFDQERVIAPYRRGFTRDAQP